MKRLISPISLSILFVFCTSFTWLPFSKTVTLPYITSNILAAATGSADEATAGLYTSLNLAENGLSTAAFNYAYKGYQRLVKKGLLSVTDYLTICDMSQSSTHKRFYLIDLIHHKIVVRTYVAHGHNSGGEFATRFSNSPSSLQSSLGFYITQGTYFGEHGLSLRINGIEPGFNNNALRRAIVVHGADYIDANWLQHSTAMGRSFGCPAVPAKESLTIINTIKNGSCLFIYYPNKKYLQRSRILNG